MRTRSTAGVGLLALALAGCGGGGKASTPPSDPTQAAAVASVTRLVKAIKADDPREACRSLTLASRRVVGLVGTPAGSCSDGLGSVLMAYSLQRSLPRATDLTAAVRGARATVRGKGLDTPITTVRNAGGWRVSLVGIPGVRGDVAAARSCGRWSDAADALPLPPFDPADLGARLRGDARLVEQLRTGLRRVPAGGPPRLGLAGVRSSLGVIRKGLLAQARKLAAGGDVQAAMDASSEGDRLVRQLFASQGTQARVACPRPAVATQEPARRAVLEGACRDYVGIVNALGGSPGDVAAAKALLRRQDAALVRLDGELGRVPVVPRLEHLRREARTALARMRSAIEVLIARGGAADLDEIQRQVEGYGAQLGSAFLRFGASCLTRRATAPVPRFTPPKPTPRRTPPRRSPPQQLPPGTVIS